MTEIKTTKIPRRQKCVDKDHPYIGGSVDIIDDNNNKTQEQINSETEERVSTLEESVGTGGSVDERIAEEGAKHYLKTETYNKTELNNMITTPNQEYVSVTATDETTAATDVLPVTGEADTIYRVGNWDGTQYNDSVFSEYAWNGSDYVKLNTKSQVGEVYDISLNHAGTTYANLAAALGTNGANIPQSLRKGGMSVKFVRSSDNKYVQWRFMLSGSFTTAQFTNIANWQGVDNFTQETEISPISIIQGENEPLLTPNNDIFEGIQLSITTDLTNLMQNNKAYLSDNPDEFVVGNTCGLSLENKTNFKCVKLDVHIGEHFSIYSNQGANVERLYALVDKNNKYISFADAYQQYVEISVTQECSLYIMLRNGGRVFKYLSASDVKKEFDKIEERIYPIKLNSYFDTTTKTFVNAQARSNFIPINGNKIFYPMGINQLPISIVFFTDSAPEYYIDNSEISKDNFMNQWIDVPANANFCIINFARNNTTNYEFELRQYKNILSLEYGGEDILKIKNNIASSAYKQLYTKNKTKSFSEIREVSVEDNLFDVCDIDGVSVAQINKQGKFLAPMGLLFMNNGEVCEVKVLEENGNKYLIID